MNSPTLPLLSLSRPEDAAAQWRCSGDPGGCEPIPQFGVFRGQTSPVVCVCVFNCQDFLSNMHYKAALCEIDHFSNPREKFTE